MDKELNRQAVNMTAVKAVVFTPLTLIAGVMLLTDPLIKIDQEGVMVDCEELQEVVKTHRTAFASYHFSSIFALSVNHETIAHYEKSKDYIFSSCKEFIDKEKQTWGNDKITNITVANVNGDLSDVIEFCAYTKDYWIKSFEYQSFDVRTGYNNIINFHGKWVSISKIKLWKPFESNANGDGFFKLCIDYDGIIDCKYQKSEEGSYKEMNRIMDLMVSTKV